MCEFVCVGVGGCVRVHDITMAEQTYCITLLLKQSLGMTLEINLTENICRTAFY